MNKLRLDQLTAKCDGIVCYCRLENCEQFLGIINVLLVQPSRNDTIVSM